MTLLFNILCDKMGSRCKTLVLHTEVWWLSGKKSIFVIELQTEIATLLYNMIFTFKNNWEIKYDYANFDIWQTNVFVEMDNCTLIWTFRHKLEFLRFISTTESLTAYKYTCLMRFLVTLRYMGFFNINFVISCVNIWKIYLIQWANIFQMSVIWFHKTMHM